MIPSNPQIRQNKPTTDEQELVEAVLESAEQLNLACQKASNAGLKVNLQIAQTLQFPGPGHQAVSVSVQRIEYLGNYNPNIGKQLAKVDLEAPTAVAEGDRSDSKPCFD